MSALSKKQKFILADLARQAYARGSHAPSRASSGAPPQSETEFRHAHVIAAVGKAGLTLCSQDDYQIVKAHFEQLLGRDGSALNSLVRHQSNPIRVAHNKLLEALTAAGLRLAYADKICRSMFKCQLDEATQTQLWKLIYTIKNRSQCRDGAMRRPRRAERRTETTNHLTYAQ